MSPATEASETWAAWACPAPQSCPQDHCARCGEHCGGQGHSATGLYFDGQWRSFGKAIGIVFSCDEAAMTAAMRAKYGDEYWIDNAIEQSRVLFFPDRRLKPASGVMPATDERVALLRSGRANDGDVQDLIARIDADAKVIAELREWRPIETAPKDGTVVVGYDPSRAGVFGSVDFMRWDGERWIEPSTHVMTPTHWKPMPALPEAPYAK